MDFASFFVVCAWKAFFLPRHDVVVALTSPPLISVLGALLARLKSGRFVYWVMDLNPDEAIAAGWLRSHSLAARFLEAVSRFSLRRADPVIVLDRFMRDRVLAKGVAPDRVAVIPPWVQEDMVRFDASGRERFRQRHGLEAKFVVMYSGNHSPCHPLDTVMQAARRLASDERIHFAFVGGGSELPKVREFAAEHRLANMLCLPYQPREELSGSLSAADLHVVVMGDAFVGTIHPSKIYNVLHVGAPVLYVGPAESHLGGMIAELADGSGSARVAHGDVDSTVGAIQTALRQNRRSTAAAGLALRFSRKRYLTAFLDCLLGTRPIPTGTTPRP